MPRKKIEVRDDDTLISRAPVDVVPLLFSPVLVTLLGDVVVIGAQRLPSWLDPRTGTDRLYGG